MYIIFFALHRDYLPILVLLYIMLYTMLTYLMLATALFNDVCLNNAYFFAIDFSRCSLFHVLSWVIDT